MKYFIKRKRRDRKTNPNKDGTLDSNEYDKSKLDLDEVYVKNEKIDQENLMGLLFKL